jgi:hypothetical protein
VIADFDGDGISDVAVPMTIGTVMRHLGLIEVWASSLRDQPEWAIERLTGSAAILARVAPELPGGGRSIG